LKLPWHSDILWLTALSLSLTTCYYDIEFKPVYLVDELFRPIVELFAEEAAARGIFLTIDNLILKSSPEIDPSLCGACNSLRPTSVLQKEVIINPGYGCWENPLELETLIFHELGHCLLGRRHLVDTLPNGDPKSLMIDADLSVYAPCRYVIGQVEDCNNVHKRAYYINELFDPNTPPPDWSK
jgi:hypothetical protein